MITERWQAVDATTGLNVAVLTVRAPPASQHTAGAAALLSRCSVFGDPELPSRAITSARLLWLESTDSSVESHDDDLPELPALIRSSDLSRLTQWAFADTISTRVINS